MARHRKPGRRTASGRLSHAGKSPPRMTSTRETERKRLALVNGSGDQALAASVPGILFANAMISELEFVACQR